MPTQKIFDQLLAYVNLYQHAQNQAISLICSGDMIDTKILQFDWLRTFRPISQEQNFSQTWDLCRNTGNNISFHYRTNSVKIDDQTFQQIQKTLFLAHFPNFWGISPPKTSSSVTHNFKCVSSTLLAITRGLKKFK